MEGFLRNSGPGSLGEAVSSRKSQNGSKRATGVSLQGQSCKDS